MANWQPIETAPTDGRMQWISDGKDVWIIRANVDGSHKSAPMYKYWTDANKPSAPTATNGQPRAPED